MSEHCAMENRMQRIRQAMQQAGVDELCVRDTSNIAWATAFEGVFDEERAHVLLVGCEAASLHTDSRYSSACRAAAKGSALEIDDARGADGKALTHAAWLAARVSGARLGIEDTIALAEYRKLQAAFAGKQDAPELVETSGLVLGLREAKDDRELECLRAAQAVADDAFRHLLDTVRPGMTERQVQFELDSYMLSHGATSVSFPTIVATGANGANPHAQPSDAPLEAGQCVVIDFGARVRGYCSDTTRMLFVGSPDARLASAYQVLREANEQVQAMLKPGVTGAQAHELAEQILAQGGYAGKMGHGLGHGVGLDVHEEPVLAPRNKQPLQVGNVVTVEPGIYLEGEFGMRLEDCGVIDQDGYHPFSTLPHDLLII